MPDHVFIDISKLMHCGVYALLKRGQVVYVGKSTKPLMRLYRHMCNRGRILKKTFDANADVLPTNNEKGINFDGIWFLPCMLGQLSTLETYFIKEHRPKYNVLHNPDLKPKPSPKEPTVIMPIPEEM